MTQFQKIGVAPIDITSIGIDPERYSCQTAIGFARPSAQSQPCIIDRSSHSCSSKSFEGSYLNWSIVINDPSQVGSINGKTKIMGHFGGLDISPEVREFCVQHGVEDLLHAASRLAAASFTIIGQPRPRLETDPETREIYVVLEIDIAEGVEESVQAFDRYLDSWIPVSNPAKRDRIRLGYYLA
jgi:hypothetical protein